MLSVVRDKKEFPVAYYSRQLQGAEANYPATELECLAVVAAVRHFETYLAGREFELVTDHHALQGLRTSRNHNRHLTRWSLFLQDFRFEVVYKPGPQNSNADGLSRQCWVEEPVKMARVQLVAEVPTSAREGGDVHTHGVPGREPHLLHLVGRVTRLSVVTLTPRQLSRTFYK